MAHLSEGELPQVVTEIINLRASDFYTRYTDLFKDLRQGLLHEFLKRSSQLIPVSPELIVPPEDEVTILNFLINVVAEQSILRRQVEEVIDHLLILEEAAPGYNPDRWTAILESVQEVVHCESPILKYLTSRLSGEPDSVACLQSRSPLPSQKSRGDVPPECLSYTPSSSPVTLKHQKTPIQGRPISYWKSFFEPWVRYLKSRRRSNRLASLVWKLSVLTLILNMYFNPEGGKILFLISFVSAFMSS